MQYRLSVWFSFCVTAKGYHRWAVLSTIFCVFLAHVNINCIKTIPRYGRAAARTAARSGSRPRHEHRQSQTKQLLLFKTSVEQKRCFVCFCLVRPPRPRPRPGGLGALVRGPAPASPGGASRVLLRSGRGASRRGGGGFAGLLVAAWLCSRPQLAAPPAPLPLAGCWGSLALPCARFGLPAVGLPLLRARPGPGDGDAMGPLRRPTGRLSCRYRGPRASVPS